MGNVKDQRVLWVHFAFTVYVVVVTLYAVFRLVGMSARLRQNFLAVPPGGDVYLAARTVMVRDVPVEWRNQSTMKQVFGKVCPGGPDGVEKVFVGRQVPFSVLVKALDVKRARRKLEDAVTRFFSKTVRRKSRGDGDVVERILVREKGLFGGRKVDAVQLCLEQYCKLQGEVKKLWEEQREMEIDSTVFVVFKEPFMAQVASLVTLHDAPAVASERICCVDSGDDVVWENCNVNYFARQWRGVVTKAGLVALILFWASMVASISTLTNLNNIAQSSQQVANFLRDHADLAKMIGGILPPAIIALLIQCIPPLLRFLIIVAGSPLKSKTEQEVYTQFFWFQICNVVIINIVGVSLLTSFDSLKQNPSSVMDTLAKSIPKSASFFIQYLLVIGLIRPSVEVVQVLPLLINPIYLWLFGKTPRTIFHAKQAPEWQYGPALAFHDVTITIGLVYCVIAPLVTVFVTLYFCLYTFVYLYMMQHVYVLKSQTGGRFLFSAANHMFVGLFVMEFMVFALFSLNQNITISSLMLLIVMMTVWAYSRARQFTSVIDTIPVQSVMELEARTFGRRKSEGKPTMYSKLINLFFPGLVIPLDHVEVGLMRGSEGDGHRIPENAFLHPAVGLDLLNVWIPHCGDDEVTRNMIEEIVEGSMACISPDRVVTTGATMDGKGNVVLADGLNEVMVKL
ncbi:DUF221-domain-containing protein [Rhizoclosmatium globosum]|uniref:DUF221-domain-containing protein n=1 Tax=Rhizoclosmatium globosum TaxID=329046 RepID=A0A1Y2C906_9FUNG|nr:DUF221-domain-containing protein [Rhizoclosmatium globosum]|eukprot:ORY43510.1 DUF221-domain-containing protein [Rhizoclosmatium globosum]